MSSGEKTSVACERFDELDLKVASGDALTDEEQRFVEDHGARCAECGLLQEATHRVRIEDDDLGSRPLNELASHRLVKRIVDQVEADEVVAPRARPSRPTGRRRWWAAVAAAAAILVIGAWLLTQLDSGRRSLLSGSGTRADRRATGRVVLVSGEVELDRSAARLSDPLLPGRLIRVGAGRAALELDGSISLLLDAHTSVRVEASPPGRVALRLQTGTLIGVVTPGRSSGRLSVRMSAARVVVVGTVFALRQQARAADVAVVRGKVRVEQEGKAHRLVAAGRLYLLGAARGKALSRKRARALWRRATVIDLLRRRRPARLALRTQPPGATAVVDGTVLGVTPLDAALKPGHRSLELRRPGRPPLREHVLLEAGTTLTRDFDVPRARPVPTAGAAWRTLLERARKRRAARDWKGAARAYAALIHAYGTRPEARVALVSLGLLQLEHLGRPADALASFRRYLALAPQGALASEALWGQARALGALGRRRQEAAALRRYLKQGGAAELDRARRRLRKLAPKR